MIAWQQILAKVHASVATPKMSKARSAAFPEKKAEVVGPHEIVEIEQFDDLEAFKDKAAPHLQEYLDGSWKERKMLCGREK